MFEEDTKKHSKSRELELFGIRNIMKTENGRAFMMACLDGCCTFEGTFSIDTHQHAFNAGRRSHGLWLQSELQHASPDDYFKMIKEHFK